MLQMQQVIDAVIALDLKCVVFQNKAVRSPPRIALGTFGTESKHSFWEHLR